MPDVKEVVQRLDAFLAELSSIEKRSMDIALMNERVEQWTRRVHATLSNWGRGEDANRLSGAQYSSVPGEKFFKAEASAVCAGCWMAKGFESGLHAA